MSDLLEAFFLAAARQAKEHWGDVAMFRRNTVVAYTRYHACFRFLFAHAPEYAEQRRAIALALARVTGVA